MEKERYLGKKVRVKINDRDINGKLIWNKFTFIEGKCTFIGNNNILNLLQITIDRTPIFPVKEEDIEVKELAL
jgi:hypothetical protein